jgi:hypothetical protein
MMLLIGIRTVLCSTNAIESLNARYRRAIKARGHFPTELAALKCLYLVTRSLNPTGRADPVDDAMEAPDQTVLSANPRRHRYEDQSCRSRSRRRYAARRPCQRPPVTCRRDFRHHPSSHSVM